MAGNWTIYNEAGEVVTDPHEQARRLGADAIYDEAGKLVWRAKSDKTPVPGMFDCFPPSLMSIGRRRVPYRK